jgi:flagella basal body P-ring formation protein FlgA
MKTLLFAALLLSSVAPAAEIRLRTQCTATGPVVKLGDVAEVVDDNRAQAERLAAAELFPAPPQGQPRFLRVREIQDLLLLRGVNVAEHQISGASQVAISAGSQTVKTENSPAKLPVSRTRQVNRRVCEAVAKYLEEHASQEQLPERSTEDTPDERPARNRSKGASAERPRRWTVEAALTEAQSRAVADPMRAISISGGHAPWTGAQQFQVTVQSPQGPVSFPLEARVSLPNAVVVACHALQRGTVLRPDDVELRRDASGEVVTAIHSIEEVVGRETTRSVSEGKLLSTDSLRAPLLVRKGEVVTVYAFSGGIRLRTVARARDEGSQGDLVAVESMLDRGTYFARVSGLREVEVYARAPRVEPVTSQTDPIVRR